MAPQLETRIAAVKARKDALAARLNLLQAKAKAEKDKRDTRRKFLVGAAVIEAMENDGFLAARIRSLLARVVTRDSDLDVIRDLLSPPAAVPTPPPAQSAELSEAVSGVT
jgi:hypothetical protein